VARIPRSSSRKTQRPTTKSDTAKKLTPLLRNKTIRQNKRHTSSQATIRTQKTRNNNVLHSINPLQRRRRIHMQSRNQHKRSNRINRKRIPIRHRNGRLKTIQKTQITPLFLPSMQLLRPFASHTCSAQPEARAQSQTQKSITTNSNN